MNHEGDWLCLVTNIDRNHPIESALAQGVAGPES